MELADYPESIISEYQLLRSNPQDFNLIAPLISKRDKSFDVHDKVVFLTQSPQLGPIVLKIDYVLDLNEYFDEIIHEAFIGLYGLNKLNSPYFAKVLGVYLSQECPEYYRKMRNDCNYVIYEYIPGPTLNEALNTMNPTEFKQVMIQILIGLYDAYTALKFTHYDLHTKNIIISRQPHKVVFKNRFLFESKFLPVIIDYGSSHIQLNGVDYGRNFYKGEIHNAEFWAHDVFKLLSMIYDRTNFNVIKAKIDQNLKDALDTAPGEGYMFDYDTDQYIESLESDIESTEQEIQDLRSSGYTEIEEEGDLEYLQKTLAEVQKYKQDVIQYAEAELVKANSRRYNNDKIADIVEQLLKFFNPQFNSEQHIEYKEEHQYFELESTPKNKKLSFNDFMNYAIPILTKR